MKQKRIFHAVPILLLLLPLMSGAEPKVPLSPEYAEGEVLVRYRESVRTESQESKANALGLRTLQTLYEPTARNERRVLHLRSDRLSTAEIVEALRGDPAVELVEPNYRYMRQAITPNDPRFPELWGLSRVGVPEAWETSTGSDGVVVAVVDSGVNYLHEDLADNMWRTPGAVACTALTPEETTWVENGTFGYDFAADDQGNDDSDPMDIDGHGTHVAGTIGAVGNNAVGVVGVNWNTRIIAVKAERPDGFFYSSDQIQALRYVRILKEKCGVNIVAVNASYGGQNSGSTLVREQIGLLGGAGIIFVAAAGNNTEENDTTPFHPANTDLPNVVSVASISSNDQLSSFSNYGRNKVHLAAPGSGILSTTMPWEGTGRVTRGTDDFPATVFTYSASAEEGITRTLHHCGLALNSSDCPGEVSGNIALIERGEINFSAKVRNATTAGAVAVIIYNSVAGGENPINGTLGSPGDWLPTLGVARSVGITLRDLGTPTVTVRTIGGYGLKSGTSMAAPHVTGALALLAAVHPEDSFDTRIERLLAAVEPLPALQETTRSGGLLNLRTVFTHPSDQPPLRPGNLLAMHDSHESVTLNWENRSARATGFVIERRVDRGVWIEAGITDANTTTLAQPGLDPARIYEWRVRAIGAGGASLWSNTARSIKEIGTGADVTGSVSPGEWHVYRLRVEPDRRTIWVRLTDLTADADLYLQPSESPTLDNYLCRPFLSGNTTETCSSLEAAGLDWYIGVRAAEPAAYRILARLAPPPPGSLTASAIEGGRAILHWSYAEDASQYRLYRRSEHESEWYVVASQSGLTYTDEGLEHGVSYGYRVVAINDAGSSFPSAEQTVTAFDGALTAPDAPSGLVVYPSAPRQLTLAWQDNSDNESGFRIERQDTDGEFQVVGQVPADVTMWDGGELYSPGRYTFRVIVFNSQGEARSEEASGNAYDAVGFRLPNGQLSSQPTIVRSGQSYEFIVIGGSGQHSVSVLPNTVSGSVASMTQSGTGWVFTPPSTGAFAGRYQVVAVDDELGWVAESYIDVPLHIELETTELRSGLDMMEAVVSGALPGLLPTVEILLGGHPSSVLDVRGITETADDSALGNPSVITLAAAEVTISSRANVRVNAGGAVGTSPEIVVVPVRLYRGRLVDRLGQPIANVRVHAPDRPGPLDDPWLTFTGVDGRFELLLPDRVNDGIPALEFSKTGYLSRSVVGQSCMPAECEVVLDIADATLRLMIAPMFPGEMVKVDLHWMSPSGDAVLFTEYAFAQADGAARVEFPLDSRIHYPRLVVTSTGYLTLESDRDGSGWTPAGADIDAELEVHPTVPSALTLQGMAVGSGVSLAGEVNRNGRNTQVWFEYGTSASLGSETERRMVAAITGWQQIDEVITPVGCGITFVYRLVAENDWGELAAGQLETVAATRCPTPPTPAPPQGGSGGGGQIGPLTLVAWLAFGWLALRRRAHHACA